MWEISGKLDPESGLSNSQSERRQQFLDSLFYNVDLITKINNSLPLKLNGLVELFVGAGLSRLLFPYFWDQLTTLSGALVRSVADSGQR